MYVIYVCSHLKPASKGFRAVSTFERLVSRMGCHVPTKVPGLKKAFSTDGTLEWPLRAVAHNMPFKVAWSVKSSLALRTFILEWPATIRLF